MSLLFPNNKVDSLPDFPRNAVHTDTEARLTLTWTKLKPNLCSKWEQVNHAPMAVRYPKNKAYL